ncbi:Dihydrofolate reductase [Geodermatophilus saharensis]|uniref:Dihydrofolate reductase n=1 Tax=Geodermatophilus saharensis TaxID=1137994 RepID=A0A239IZB3_9ACTN|nr:dihydrofolate reductase family protein [Geodermatophilus saharensis]SNS98981.1 Dihydrofolate reductase [Geodermatophilus saharensis]
MGRLVITQNSTLDGVVDATGGWFVPQDDGADTPDQLDVVREHMAGQSVFLVGRRTFEEMRGFWPQQAGDTTGISAHLDAVEKAVVSRTLTEPGWANTTVLAGDPVEEVARLVADREGEVGVTGSITLCHALIAAGLVDEYRLFVFPRVLGRGRRLFPDGTDVRLTATGSGRTFRSGVTLLTYRPA